MFQHTIEHVVSVGPVFVKADQIDHETDERQVRSVYPPERVGED